MKYAWVTTNVLDLWARPGPESGRESQLLYGEVVRVEKQRKGYCCVSQFDGYSGWIDARFLSPASRRAFQEFPRTANAVVFAHLTALYGPDRKRTVAPHFLYYGTILRIKSGRDRFQQVILPGEPPVFIKAGAIRPINRAKSRPVPGFRLVAEARRFLGVPYLWGGVTVSGFDCSGLVRAVCARFGMYMPRDTKDQISVGQRVERERIKSGDLLFFKRHVGLAVGRTHIIHASRGGGGVRLEALVPGLPDYREDLDGDFAQARRITA